MKSAVYHRYGPPEVVEIADVPRPDPADDEVLIRIHATTVTSGDWRARSLEMPPGFGPIGRLVFGMTRPRQPVLGTELAGEIETVGSDVTSFVPGERVFAFPGAAMGCHAEYRCVKADGVIARQPANLSHDESAALPFGGTTALSFLRRGKVRSGERVLINGASGGVGTAAVQLARHFGAHVTGVCSSANVELVRSLGAHDVVDYTRDDFTASGERYDIVMDTVGNAPLSRSGRVLKEDGRLLVVLGGLGDMLRAPWVAMTSSRRVVAGPVKVEPEDLRYLARLAETGQFRPHIERRYPLEAIVDAHRHVDSGRKKGNVVVTVTH